MTDRPPAWVYDGTSPQDLHAWCTRLVGPGSCNYVWSGASWDVSVRTVNGHEPVRYGDTETQVAPDQLAVQRRDSR